MTQFVNIIRVLIASLIFFLAQDVLAAEPFTASNPVSMTAYLKVIIGLAFVIALFLLSSYLFKRYGNGPMAARGQLKVIDGLHISHKERLMLVDLQGKRLLLAITPGSITKLDTIYADNDNSIDSSIEQFRATAASPSENDSIAAANKPLNHEA